MTVIPIHRPLLPITLCYLLGNATGLYWPGGWLPAGGLLLVGAMSCLWHVVRRTSTLLPPLMLFLALGYLSIQPWMSSTVPDHHVRHFLDQGRQQLQGVIVGAPRTTMDGRTRLVIAADRLTSSQVAHDVCGKVRVTLRGKTPPLARGDRIEAQGYLHGIRNFYNPGGFDYERYMALRGIHARLASRGDRIRILSSGPSSDWRTWLDQMRRHLARLMDVALANRRPEAAAVLKALIIGERSAVSSELRDRFNRAGVGHVLAISGLHIGMVATGIFFVAMRLLSWVPMLLHRAWTRKGAALAAMLALGAYAVLSGLSPSTQRAALMGGVLLLTFWFGRPYDWLNTVALAALVIVVIDPPSLSSISFQLSFAAVISILLGVSYLDRGPTGFQRRPLQRLIHGIGVFAGISILAVVGTLPLVMTYFNQVSLVGVAANLVVVPLVGWAVLPLGLTGVAAAAVSTGLAHGCWWLAGFVLEGMLAVVFGIAQWPLAAVKTFTPGILESALYFGLLVLILTWRRVPYKGVALGLILLAASADTAYWTFQRFGRQDLRLTVLDVGQGSGNVLHLPGGRTVLVDGGGFSDNRVFDVGRSLVAPYLWRLKIKTVDLVILSHPNSDHYNGLIYILEHFNVGEVWSNHEAAATESYAQFAAVIQRQGIHHPDFAQLARQQERWGAVFELLAPDPGFLTQRTAEPWRDENEDSLVLRVQWGRSAILFTGDIGQRTEKRLVRRLGADALAGTILMIPHHGSRHSSSDPFLKAVNPDRVVISCGWQNRYGFPHGEVLERLDRLGCEVWRTDLHGAVRLTIGERGCEVHPTLR